MPLDADRSTRLYAQTPSALRPGTRLGEFELLSVLGVGGFGIVYLALDHDLEREVAIKEYLPATLAGRTESQQVSLRSQADAETFALGLKSFVNETRLLARIDHPSLLKVYRFWEANGTAYMVMPLYRGRTLKALRQARTDSPDEAWQDWGSVRASIEKMPPALAAQPAWVYWLGRAYRAGGRLEDANTLFAKIAGQPDFYGSLANDELGRSTMTPPKASPPSREELAQVSAIPGVRRAQTFFRLNLRSEGSKEWSWALRSMGSRSVACREAALDVAERLAASTDKTERWVGKDVLRDIQRPMIAERTRKRDAKRAAKKK